MNLGNYDRWKTTEPDFSHPDDDTRCPHGEDGDCELCNELVEEVDGPDDEARAGCVLGDDCLHHDPFHTAAECFDVEMAKHFMGVGE